MKILKNKINLFFILSIIALLLIGSITSYGKTSNIIDKNDKVNKKGLSLKVSSVSRYTDSIYVKIPDLLTTNTKSFAHAGNSLENILVTSNSWSESYPSMIVEKNDCLLAYECENEGETSIFHRHSIDYGQNWSDETQIIANIWGNPIEIDSPSLSIIPSTNEAYGLYTSPLKNRAVFGYFDISDISNPNYIVTYTFDWTGFPDPEGDPDIFYSFWGFKTPQIITFNDVRTPWVSFLIGSTNYTYEHWGACNDSIMICFNDLHNPEMYVTISWFADIEHCSNISLSRDYSDSIIYGICEIKNFTNQDLLFFKGNPEEWYNNEGLINQTFASLSNLTHPDISVSGDNIYIVVDSDIEGIIIYNSSNKGESWDVKKITEDLIPPTANPNYPNIYLKNNQLFCTFIESNNIFLTCSKDNGENWINLVQLNSEIGSVVEEYRFTSLIDELHVLWTDDRSGNNDIYLALLNEPPNQPEITGPRNGKPKKTYDFIIIATDPDNDNISYIINWGDNTSDRTEYHPSGEDISISHSWEKEGNFTIIIKSKDTGGFESDWSEPFEIEIPRTRATSYHWLFECFPLLERLLSIIF